MAARRRVRVAHQSFRNAGEILKIRGAHWAEREDKFVLGVTCIGASRRRRTYHPCGGADVKVYIFASVGLAFLLTAQPASCLSIGGAVAESWSLSPLAMHTGVNGVASAGL